MKLTGQEREQICQALLSAFPTRNGLAQWVSFGLNQNLATIAEGNNLAEGVVQLVSWAEEHGQLAALVSAALKANPANPDLQAVQALCDWVKLDQWDPWNEPVPCPYPGMSAFRIDDAQHFHGRQNEIDTLLQLLRVQRLVMVIGPSGSGKSSLVYAGLLSRLGTSSFWRAGHWLVRQMRPGADPIQKLQEVLEGGLDILPNTLQSLLRAHAPNSQLLLFVDQFEELFTQTSPADQQRFIRSLQSLRSDPSCTLLLTMRADFYPELMNCGLWPLAPGERLEIAPLRGDALRDAIAQPAVDVKVALEANLLERLLADAADEPGVLPLLQETLVLLWNKMQRRRLSLSTYEQLGRGDRSGLMVALSIHADAFLSSLSPDYQPVARRILLRLVQFGEGRPDTRRQQPRSALCIANEDPALFDQALQKLVSARLLTLSGDDGQEIRVDLAHEALISGWPQFQEWLKAERQMELGRRRLLAQAAEWRRLGGQEGGLLDRLELAEADAWLADAAHLGIDAEILTLLQRSRQAVRLDVQAQEALRQIEIAAEATKHLERDWQLSLLLTMEAVGTAWRKHRLVEPQARQALILTLMQSTAHRVLQVHECNGMDWSPHGELLLTSHRYNNGTQVWNIADAAVLTKLPIEDAAWSPDGTVIIGATRNGTSVVLDASTGNTLSTVNGIRPALNPDASVVASYEIGLVTLSNLRSGDSKTLPAKMERLNSMVWSPTGKYLSTAEGSGSLKVWSAATGSRHATFDGHNGTIWSMDWSPHEDFVATAGNDWTICVWNIEGEYLHAVLLGHVAKVLSLQWSPDGRHLASGSADGTVRIWDPQSGRELAVLAGHQASVNHVRWRADSQTLASASDDTTIKVWNTSNTGDVTTLLGHDAPVLQLCWSPDDQYLASRAEDHTLRIWDLPGASPVELMSKEDFIENAEDFMCNISWSPDGRFIAIPNPQNTVDVWDLARQCIHLSLQEHRGHVNAAVWSPDGDQIISVGEDQNVILWDAIVGEKLLSCDGHTAGIQSAAWDVTGGYVTTWDANQTARVWDISTGLEISSRQEHDAAVIRAGWNAENKMLSTITANGVLRQGVDGERPGEISVATGVLCAVGWHPRGPKLACGDMDGRLTMWDAVLHKEAFSIQAHQKRINVSNFSPNGQLLLTASDDRTAKVWDANTGELNGEMTGHKGWIIGAAWHPDGSMVATLGFDGYLRIWDARTWSLQNTLKVSADWMKDHDWRRKITASMGGNNPMSSSLGTFDLLALAQTRIVRTLSEDEMDTYIRHPIKSEEQ